VYKKEKMVFLQHDENTKKDAQRFAEEFRQGDKFVDWLYQPHTITGLIIGGAVLIYIAFTRDESNIESNIKYGIGAACCVFLLFCSFHMRDGLFIRPHPIFWRFIMGCGIIYLTFLVFVFLQDRESILFLLKKYDPTCGTPLPERSYADDCRVWTPDASHPFKNLRDTIFDEFILAHLLGWWGKAILLRDFYLLWIWSILFECLEISFKHMLPNFAECWWDQVILDILVCNGFGIYLGLKFCDFFQMKPFNWVAKVDKFNWGVLSSPRRLIATVSLIVVLGAIEVDAFFLKFIFNIPPRNPLNSLRLLLWWSIGLPAVREYYQYISDPTCKRLGPMLWVVCGVAGLEFLICVKFGQGLFPRPAPPHIVWGWTLAIGAFISWAVFYYAYYKHRSTTPKPSSIKTD